ncbi:DHA2 family efflux MFS transporter permease subunit [Streptomyces millisiae]|uniref:DHA2 family efflux MFS transporter permease subunit n=1 Tax=Streptomyces millisiae TaxID=3075542 RepID=A0ABU2LIX3_9ACTN|nr:DHA2 family efflux MFS transporter permease subunit [Streptomyces sp. DSM 44918]MDT0317527.1 DHA2 family efflux MFS transporter permease subunit [Streptomyces sp. DSM 44918]
MPETETLSRGRRLLVLAICCMSLLIVSLDITALNVALPSLERELGASVSGLQWTVDIYTVVLASFLMLSGSTADRVGRRRVFQIGLVVFTAGSLLCALAPSLGWLVAFRAAQAIGGSMLNPVAMSIITNTFRDPKELARAIGVWGGVVGISMAVGPILGGALVSSFGWRAIFWLNLPVGLAALVLTARFVPESRAPRPRRLDPVGQVLVIVLLGSLTFGIIEGGKEGWGSPVLLVCFGIALLAVCALLWYEPRRAEPLLELRFFRSVPFSGAFAIAVLAFAGLGGFLFLNTIYLQNERHLSPFEAGAHLLPMAVVTLFASPLSGYLVGHFGARVPLLPAGVAILASGLLLTRLEPDSSLGLLFSAYALFGIGFGLVNAPITNTAVTGMPRAQAGVAAGIASTGRQVGSALGVAVVGTILANGSRTAGWWVIAGCGALVLVVGALTTGRRARATAERAMASFAAERPAGAARP